MPRTPKAERRSAEPGRIYTIGHSTRSFDEFVALLAAHGVAQVADVRTVPRSRRNPQFSREALAIELPRQGIGYRHFPELGGLRRPLPDSKNSWWQNASFRGYADYMQTDAFAEGVAALLDYARHGATAAMCAEAVWWRCHRSLLADALVVADLDVRHIMSRTSEPAHELHEHARLRRGHIVYPGLL